MVPQLYDGNIHPNEWLNQIKTYCFLKQITESKDIIKFAKMMVDSTIYIPSDITSLNELIDVLKADISFTIFKNTNKRKLQALRYKSENVGGDTSKFIGTFRKLCRNAEITDLEELKKYFVQTLSCTFKNKFLKETNDDEFDSLNDIILRFNNLLIEPKISVDIKNGSIVALKHVATGKYLSTIENLRYKTGSKSQMIFIGGLEPDRLSLWKIKFDKDFATADTVINLQHQFDKFLGVRYSYSSNRVDNYYKSPSEFTEGN
ncbi:hypothetical protein C1645_131897 [Glomus cerebriforme]|uniref:MIR domain-containing protein n=1 Tax=Glomus cerebriforme TaxID=658196 RepID=A0A397SZV8_9GLOM|nr:hypothetical protein C1645_131897 [Glomus cerebriforme]